LKIVKKFHLGRLATFAPNKGLPVYNWVYFKEAFSRDLVFLLAESFGLGKGDLVLDPFCGVATTLLACKQLGIDSIGYDVHPIMLFASRVKLRDYDVEELKPIVRKLVKLKFEMPRVEVPDFVARAFSRSILEDVVFFRQKISEVEDERTREFLLLGLMNAATRCSWAFKDGAAIKVRKRRVPPLRNELRRQLMRMCHDVEHFEVKPCRATVKWGDARRTELEDESVDAVITSPPYLGKREYIYAYRIEQEILGLGGPPADGLIGVRDGGETEDFSEVEGFIEEKPLDAKLYFKDMFTAIKELFRVCKNGAKVALVTSDGCFRDGVVEVCVPLSEMAKEAGFRAKRVLVVNRRFCTTPQRKKVGVAQEALLLWEK